MRSLRILRRWLLLLLLIPAVSTCEEANAPGLVAPGTLAVQPPAACNLRDAIKDARGFFPGQGQNSALSEVKDVVAAMEDDCESDDGASYTGHWFDIAAITQAVLEAGDGGDPADGASFFAATLTLLGPGGSPIFDPCDGAAATDCLPWDGYPDLPDFASVLGSPDGAWAVVSGTDALCSGFRYPCSGIDAAIDGDVWGVEPSVTWEAALHGRTTLVFGTPIPGPSPTGEPLLDTDLPAYQWLMIPDPDEFGVDLTPPAVLEVGLCSTQTPEIDEILVQKGSTVLTEAVIDFCDSQIPSVANAATTPLGRLAATLSAWLRPIPAPLIAAVARFGPGGSAASFTDFYAIDLPREALVVIPSQPQNGTVGEPLLAEDGETFRVRTITSSMASPLEDALVTIEIIGNNGLIPSGNGVSGANVECEGFVCTGRTQADQEDAPGELELGLVITKTGSYTLCFTGSLPPLDFGPPVCTDKYVVNP